MTQEEIARLMGRSRVVVSDLERGRTSVSAVHLTGYAAALQEPITFFFADFPVLGGVKPEDLDD